MDTVLPILLVCCQQLAGVIGTRRKAAKAAPRRSPGRPSVPLGKIIATALQIGDDEGAGLLSTAFHSLDPHMFPATVTVADHLPVPLQDEFAFGLELIIDGPAQLNPSRR